MARYFNREEAEALLPAITIMLQAIQRHRRETVRVEETLARLRLKTISNGHNLQQPLFEAQRELAEHVEALRTTLSELEASGCVLKDPEMGLIDFLSLREGREVCLCWHLGEERINYWHTLEAGFAGRQSLDEEA